MSEAPYGIIDPNSQHQVWGRWIFGVEAAPTKCPPVSECVDNARRFLAALLQSTVGRVRCDQQGTYYVFVAEIDGPPPYDPDRRAWIKREFRERFMRQGFGHSARLVRFEAILLAGDSEDGKPPEQMLVMPFLNPLCLLWGQESHDGR